jgi:hypothetical protein
MLIALRSGLAGEIEPLRKFGVDLSAAAVEQRALTMTGKEHVDQLTMQEKVAARYNIILEQTAIQQGDVARTAEAPANKQRELSAAFKDTAAALGKSLLPIFLQVAGVVSTLADKFAGLSPSVQKFAVFAGLALAAIGPLATMLGGLATIIGLLASPIIAVGLAIGVLVAAAVLLYLKWDEVWEAVGNNPWLLAILAPLGAILIPIIALVAAIKLVQANWETIWPILQGVVQTAGDIISPILGAIDAAGRGVGAAVVWLGGVWQAAWPTIQAVLEVAWSVMQGILGAAAGAVSAISGAIGFLRDVWNEAWPVVQSVIETAWGIMQAPLNALRDVLSGIVGVVGWIKDNAGGAWDSFTSACERLWGVIDGPLNAMRSVLDGIVSAARSVARAIDAIPSLPNVKLPGAGGGVPFIPGIASGGYVPSRPGGLLANIAEGGEGEWVVPDSKVGQFVAKHGGGGTTIGNVQIYIDGSGDPAAVAREVKANLMSIGAL